MNFAMPNMSRAFDALEARYKLNDKSVRLTQAYMSRAKGINLFMGSAMLATATANAAAGNVKTAAAVGIISAVPWLLLPQPALINSARKGLVTVSYAALRTAGLVIRAGHVAGKTLFRTAETTLYGTFSLGFSWLAVKTAVIGIDALPDWQRASGFLLSAAGFTAINCMIGAELVKRTKANFSGVNTSMTNWAQSARQLPQRVKKGHHGIAWFYDGINALPDKARLNTTSTLPIRQPA
jgi:hypothetical protein